MRQHLRSIAMASTALVALACILPTTAAFAQDASGPAAGEQDAGSDIVVTGSRFGSRSAAQSVVPIDTISADDLARGGRSEVQDMLKTSVPSFNTPRPSASGVGDFTTPPTLRGLSTGQLLLLVNGKRRHSTGDLSTSNGIGRGDVAYDFNAIPSMALSNVEILRDGASAQYGSDAIAGVINLTLDKSTGVKGKVSTGITEEGDGEYIDVGASVGLPVWNGGVIRATVQYQNHAATDRSEDDTRQQYFGRNAAGAPVLPSSFYGSGTGLTASAGALDAREATVDRRTSRQGNSGYEMKSIFLNAEIPMNDGGPTFYGFGGYSDLDGKTPFFFRRAGQDQTVRALHPDGYIPYGNIGLRNVSATGGLRGEDLAGFDWDVSTGYGKSLIDNATSNSNNVSYGLASPTKVYMGSTRYDQWTTNLDLTRKIDVGDEMPLNLAFGAEYREETYRLIAGEPASYASGGAVILDGPNAGKPAPVGFQPSPGINPLDEIFGKRNSKAVYAELEKELFGRLTLDAAVRHEDFSDFGGTTNYKLSSRLQVIDPVAIRGSFSTGFRAPHLAQIYFGNTVNDFINGAPVLRRNLPVNSAAAQLIGAEPLRPEKSKNISAGIVYDQGGLTITVDAYQIKLKDRIVQSSAFQGTALTNLLAANGVSGIGSASYITNAVDTTTRGIDVTLTDKFDLGSLGELSVLLAGNYNKTKFDRIAGTPDEIAALGITTALFDLTQQVRISDSQPRSKVLLNLNWTSGDFALGITNTYYGKVSAVAFTSLTPAQIAALTLGYDVTLVPVSATSANSQVIQHFKGKIITDVQVSYDFTPAIRLSAGVNNLLDIYPAQNLRSTVASVAAGTNGSDNAGTLPYNAISPFGFNGMSFFASAAFKF
ncbi:TonB-dependent siderophore receptor [Novosphingobium sp. AP12]|uniref:TonB-dependent receptor plug domain-containing protein n=1 Tax=Novosphingobium sp. AP12 TaxID=1144305 RepID=UPI0002721A00|nr:TonB-dependent receptor [Novosphingobium sp. AP12]EJL27978.1 outer membrane receptor for ferrienterochelin and colicin [Novosphingobium sp. AP12]